MRNGRPIVAVLLGAILAVSVIARSALAVERSNVAASSNGVAVLSLRVGEIHPKPVSSLHLKQAAPLAADGYYVIQLDGPLTPQRKGVLLRAGVRLGQYLPHFAYIVRFQAGFDPAGALGKVGFVRWVGAFEKSWKLDPEIGQRAYRTPTRQAIAAQGQVVLIVTLFEGEPAAAARGAISDINGAVVHRVEPLGRNQTISLTIRLADVAMLSEIASVQFVEDAPEVTLRNSTTRWIVQSNIEDVTPVYDNGVTGLGQIVGVLDGKIDANHCSFFDTEPFGPNHRKIVAYNSSPGSSVHGTHVAGTAVGHADLFDDTTGIAYDGRLVYNTIPGFNEAAIVSRLTLHHEQGARLHTNSWGNDDTTAYDSLARGFDVFGYEFEESLVMLAVTNTATLKNPENAKNLLAVGGSREEPDQHRICTAGRGPTRDGRRKPEIFAPGCNTFSARANSECGVRALTGTSMASPAVAGVAMLIRQYYVEGFYPSGMADPRDAFTPSGPLIKATLLNSAVDMTEPEGYPSDEEGWGRVLADDGMFFDGDLRNLVVLEDVRHADGLSTGEASEHVFSCLGSVEKLKVTLVWADPPATAGAEIAWINDLDLEVWSPTGTLYLGNFFEGGVSVPGGTKDERNNVEQVHIETPEIGQWTVRVAAAAVNEGIQGFAVIATGEIEGELAPLTINIRGGAPDRMPPLTPVSFEVDVRPGVENILPGSPTLHYRYAGGDFISEPLLEIAEELYEGTLPVANCGDAPEFYLSAEGDGGSVVTDPPGAPDNFYSALVGVDVVLLMDDFESDMGWTVENIDLTDGAWDRGIPADGDRGDPPTDFDGSGSCYLTDNEAGNSDVDGGPTILISPTFDLSDATEPTISYARWFFSDDNDIDRLDVEVSNDNGTTWTIVESVPQSEGWIKQTFRLRDFITPTSQMKVRFSATDNPNDSITEGGIDAFSIDDFVCNDDSVNILPQDVQVVRGRVASGGIADLFESDDSRLVVQPGLTQNPDEPPVWLILSGTSVTESPSQLSFTLETQVDTPGVTQRIELFDFTLGAYEEVDVRIATRMDSVVEVVVKGDPSRFVDPETLELNAQLTFKPPPLVLLFPWSVGIDQAVWTVFP